MRMAGVFYALTLGALAWITSFFLTEYITTTPELLLFPGMISGMLNGFIIIFAVNLYVKKYKIKNWFIETLIIGTVIALFSFALDYVIISAFARNPIVLVSYPLYIVFSTFGGYLSVKK